MYRLQASLAGAIMCGAEETWREEGEFNEALVSYGGAPQKEFRDALRPDLRKPQAETPTF
jgi:hypothetical protein